MAHESFGFTFWLKWILSFAGAFAVSAIFWTLLLGSVFGRIEKNELELTWCLAVFGSWFLFLIPFMRKKERIWKRFNDDQEKAAALWQVSMNYFVGVLIASCLAWSFYYRDRIAVREGGGFEPAWVKAVLATWLVSLMPLLVWMYRKTDEIFKAALERQANTKPIFRSIFVKKSERSLPSSLCEKLQGIPPTLREGHLITAVLDDGTRISDLFVVHRSEIIGVYDRASLDFDVTRIKDVDVIGSQDLPPYEESKWLRLDGRL
ncbi:MAG: hypothetical protein Q8R76_04515 [Candidatus Omnitrophota bacterium]|nr:hypothetical protein [Candidatus Omnitrophota bacterium]